jgi:hypothetical protein
VAEEHHATGVQVGVTVPYGSPASLTANAGAFVRGGFACSYGQVSVCEDIATYVAAVQYNAAREDALCATLSGAGSPFPKNLALPYAKTVFLRSLGLVDADKADACLGGARIDEGPPGINLPGLASGQFNEKLKTGWVVEEGRKFFTVMGRSQDNAVMIRVADEKQRPLGLHRLDTLWLPQRSKPVNALLYANDTWNNRSKTSRAGLVLVTEAQVENGKLVRARGALLFLSVLDVFGNEVYDLPLGTFLVDATGS